MLDLAGNPVTGIGLTGVEAGLTTAVPPHNDFLRVFVETGLVGLAAYVALLATMAWVAWRCARRAPTPLGRAVGVAATGCVAAFLWLSVSSNLFPGRRALVPVGAARRGVGGAGGGGRT